MNLPLLRPGHLALALAIGLAAGTGAAPGRPLGSAAARGGQSLENFVAGASAVPEFGVYQVSLVGNGSVPNPYDTVATVTFTPPSGPARAKTVNAFYDGGNTWRARVYANEIGRWTWRSTSARVPRLGHRSGTFRVVASSLRGMLRKSSVNPHQWMTEDGRTFLTIADTAYYLFARKNHDGTAITQATFEKYVRDDVSLNVDFILADLNGGGYLDPQWSNIFSDPGAYDTPNLAAFQTTDTRLEWLLEKHPGVYLNVEILPENSSGQPGNTQPDNTFWSNLTKAQKTRLLRYIVARYSAFPQITWSITNDSNYGNDFPRNTEMVAEVGRYFAAHDPLQHLLATGANRNVAYYFKGSAWNTYIRLETDLAYDASQVASYASHPDHVYVSENHYEGEGAVTNGHWAYFYRWVFWSWLTAGGSMTYGSAYWDRLVPYATAGWHGLDSVRYIAPYLDSRHIDVAQWRPADGLVTDLDGGTGVLGPHAMRKGTSGFLAYDPDAASAGPTPTLLTTPARLRVNLRGAPGTFHVQWFRASDGATLPGGTVEGGAPRLFTAPWPGQDVVLYLRKT